MDETGGDKTSNVTMYKSSTNEVFYKGNFNLYIKYSLFAYTFMLTFGLPGNILCLLTLRLPTSSKTARGPLCFTLALVDATHLVLQYLRLSYTYYKSDDIRHASEVTCKLTDFQYVFLIHTDAWLIVVMSIDRLVAVFKPYTVKTLITPRRMKCFLMGLGLFFFVFDAELIFRYVPLSSNIQQNGNSLCLVVIKRIPYHSFSLFAVV